MSGRINLICLLTSLFLLVTGGLAEAVERHVPSAYGTIQAAIDAAVNSDTVIVAPGTYYENVNINGKAIILTGTEPNDSNVAAATIIDGNSLGSVVTILNVNTIGEKLLIAGLTITNGLSDAGGGIYCQDSNLVISGCVISGNKTIDGVNIEYPDPGDGGDGGDGGGVYCSFSSVTVDNTKITANATGHGGYGWNGGNGGNGAGIYCGSSSLMVRNSTINGNLCGSDLNGNGRFGSPGNGGNGAGIYCDSSSLMVSNSNISGNLAGYSQATEGNGGGNGGSGAGIYCDSSSLKVSNSNISGNLAGYGGESYGPCGNGGDGGGIFYSGLFPVNISGSSICRNTAGSGGYGNGGNGGGIYCTSPLLVIDCNISNNTAGNSGDYGNGGNGGGIYCTSSLSVKNCNLSGNRSGWGSGYYSYAGTDGGDGGGIWCSSATLSNCTINGNATRGGGSGNSYNGNGGDGGGIYCSSVTITNCTINGNTTGDGGWGSESSYGNGGNGAGIYCDSATISNCTINGNRTGSSLRAAYSMGGNGGDGAGVYFSSSGTITDCNIINNQTGNGGPGGGGSGYYGSGGDGGNGGGIFGSATIINCIIVNNTTGAGGSSDEGGAGGNGGSGAGIFGVGTIINCIIAKNTTGGGGYGGVNYYECACYPGGNGGDGAGIFGSATIVSCTVVDNTTGPGGRGGVGGGGLGRCMCSSDDGLPGQGAGIYSGSRITNTIVWANTPDQLAGQNCNNVTYCDIGDSVCSGGVGNISADPSFVDPNNGDYHLLPDSPCIDAGDPNYVSEAGETDFEGNPRIIGGRIDIGADEYWDGWRSDLNHDGKVNSKDYSIFAYYWLEYVCSEPDWCEGCDYDHSGVVDLEDLQRFAEDWMCFVEDISLVGYWKFDEGSGQFALDLSGHGNKGTLKNGTSWGDGILCFDGVDDWVEVNDSNTLDITNQITLSAWVYFDNNPTKWTKIVIKPYESYSDPWELYCIDFGHNKPGSSVYNIPRFMITNGLPAGNYGGAYDVNYVLPVGSWHQVVGTYDGSIVRLYVDGQPVVSSPATLQIGTNNMPLSIGGRLGTNDSFNGCVDNVRIYNRALTQDEVLDLYNEELIDHSQ